MSTNTVAETVSANIRRWMNDNDCQSLRKAAPRLGVHYTYLGRLLNGRVNLTLSRLDQLASRMGTTVAGLTENQQAS